MDDDGIEWLTLNNSRSWDEPKDIGKEKYEYKLLKHDVYLAADAILVKQQDKEEAILSLDGRDLWNGVELPTDDWQYLVNRENLTVALALFFTKTFIILANTKELVIFR